MATLGSGQSSVFMQLALDVFYLLGFALVSPYLVYRFLRRRAWPWGPLRVSVEAGPGAVWLHGSSVGEVSLVRPLIELLEQRRPDLELVISSHTETGVESARRAYPAHAVFRFPLDLSWLQRRLMRRLAPSLLIVVESDLWPNHLLAARRAGVPVAIVNAKLSDRSYGLHRLTRIVPHAMAEVALVAAQTRAHADRFVGLGIPSERVFVTGNMKYDLAADDGSVADSRALREALGFAGTDIVIIGGSLHPGEDLDLLSAYKATRENGAPTRLIIVPRYPEQAARVRANAVESGCPAVLKSELDLRPGSGTDPDLVVVVDTLGVLRRLYAAADIAFVGGSLYYRGANKGGHNLMEPAILGLPVIFGPHNFSFRETVADLLSHDAGIEVHDRRELTEAIAGLAGSAERRAQTGRRARQVVLDGQGAALRNLELILPILNDGAGCSLNPEDAQCRHQARSQLLNE